MNTTISPVPLEQIQSQQSLYNYTQPYLDRHIVTTLKIP